MTPHTPVAVLTTAALATGSIAITARHTDRLAVGPPDVFPLPPEPFPFTVGAYAADSGLLRDSAAMQQKQPTAPVGFDLSCRQQGQDITLVASTDPASTLPYSITPPAITLYSGDTGPVLRFHVVADDTGANLDLTGASVQFLLRRTSGVSLAIPSVLSGCTVLPNPTQLEQQVVGSSTAQSVIVDTTAGTGLVSNGAMNVGLPGTTTYETIASVTVADGTHLYGAFTKNHNVGEPVTEVSVVSPDPVYNARAGYCTYDWPQGVPLVPATYSGQLKITFASGVVEHTAVLTITVQEGF